MESEARGIEVELDGVTYFGYYREKDGWVYVSTLDHGDGWAKFGPEGPKARAEFLLGELVHKGKA